jgi:hypothetical protein
LRGEREKGRVVAANGAAAVVCLRCDVATNYKIVIVREDYIY